MVAAAYRPDPIAAATWFRQYYKLDVPVNAVDAARRAGLNVMFSRLSSRISAMLLPNDNEYVIVVNQRHPFVKCNFSVAHEIGHWVMHRYSYKNLSKSTEAKRKCEREANIFASEILMPHLVVAQLADRMPLEALAAHFGVSLQAMDIRLREVNKPISVGRMISVETS